MANKKYLDLNALKVYHSKLKPVIESKANSSEVYNKTDVYNKSEVDSALDSKSDVGHTHNQYVTEQNVYTKEQIDLALESKSDINHTHDQYLTDIGIDISFDGLDTLKGTATDYKILGVDSTKTYYLSGTKFIGPRCTHITITPIIGTSATCTYDEKTGIVSWTIYGTSSSGPVSANLSWIGAPGVLTSTKDGTENIIGYFNTVNGQSIVSNEGISDILLDFVGTSDYDHDVTLLCDNPESFFINNSTGEHETGWSNFINGLGFTKNTGTYSKPSGGIPKTDLDSSVQESLNKADTAIQDISGKANLDGGNTFSGLQSINAPTNVSGSEQTNMKIKTSNGGSIAFGKEGQNSGTMIRLDQKDGTCRLRFRSSATAGAMVWEQPEQGAQLYIDLGKDGADKHRIKFPSSAGTLALKSQIPTVNNGTLTIQKNGTNVQTFTANQSGNVTANITVPTKTSELTNDSGFLTSHQDISGKADKSNTLSGYGITDAYTKTEVDNKLNAKANSSNVYTKTETNNLINSITKTVVFDTYDKFIQFLEDTSQATYDYFNVGDSVYIKEEGSDYWISGKEDIVEDGYRYRNIIGTTGSSLMGTDNIYRTTVTENIGTTYTSVTVDGISPSDGSCSYSNFSWNSSTGVVKITLESIQPSKTVTVTLKCHVPASGGGDYGYYYISNIGPDISGKANLAGNNTFTGGQTITGNNNGYSIDASGYVKGSWLQAPSTGKASANTGKVCVLDNAGWVYYRTPAEIVSDGGGITDAYTKTEIDNKLSGKDNVGHTHAIATTNKDGFMSSTQVDVLNYLNGILYEYIGETYGDATNIDSPNSTYSMQIGDYGFTIDDAPPRDSPNNILQINKNVFKYKGQNVLTSYYLHTIRAFQSGSGGSYIVFSFISTQSTAYTKSTLYNAFPDKGFQANGFYSSSTSSAYRVNIVYPQSATTMLFDHGNNSGSTATYGGTYFVDNVRKIT